MSLLHTWYISSLSNKGMEVIRALHEAVMYYYRKGKKEMAKDEGKSPRSKLRCGIKVL